MAETDCSDWQELRRSHQRTEQPNTERAILLPEAHFQLCSIWGKGRNPKRDYCKPRRLVIPVVFKQFGSRDSWRLGLVELGLVIGRGGRDISQANAEAHIAGYGKFLTYSLLGYRHLLVFGKPWRWI